MQTVSEISLKSFYRHLMNLCPTGPGGFVLQIVQKSPFIIFIRRFLFSPEVMMLQGRTGKWPMPKILLHELA